MKTFSPNRPFQHYPPVDRSKDQPSKPHFLNKWKNKTQSFINMNRSMAQKATTPIKVTKKFSFQMKNNHSKPNPLIRSLKITPKQKTVPKSKSTNLILKDLPQKKSIKITRRVPQNKADQQKKLFQWRISTHFPLVKIMCTGSKQITERTSSGEVLLDLELEIQGEEDIMFHLHEIQQFSLLNSIYIIEESLVSFQRLYHKFGYFEPTLKMIFITNSHKCKIWANQKIWQNFPIPPKFVSRQHQKQEYFYKKITTMFAKYFKSKTQNQQNNEGIKKYVNLVDKLIHELQRTNDFIQGMKFVKEFMSAYSLKINNRFIHPIEISETRSRIFSKLQKSQPKKGTSLDEIPLKEEIPKKQQILTKQEIPLKYESPDLEQKNIKTLKNSYHNQCSKQVLESNVKTIIIESKSQQKEKGIPIKKKSQISICSKETIVEKKSRFSMYEEKKLTQAIDPVQSRHLPNFTQQDFNEEKDDAIPNQDTKNIKEENDKNQNHRNINDDEEEYEEKVRNEIEKNVREKNGWLLNAQLLFDTDDCAKSFKDSQPSIKMKISERNLSKLNRIKTSIAHSIID